MHLKVANIERALGFYCGVLGFELIARFGQEAAFISAGGYRRHIGLNTWESRAARHRRPERLVFIIWPFLSDAGRLERCVPARNRRWHSA